MSNKIERKIMDTNRWKSVAVRKTDYDLLKGLCKEKFRAPASMIAKLVDDYVKHLAKKQGANPDDFKQKLIEFGVCTSQMSGNHGFPPEAACRSKVVQNQFIFKSHFLPLHTCSRPKATK